jgi:hypothetical protein
MTPAGQALRESVATVIRDAAPFALCSGCIASKSKLSLPEGKVRARHAVPGEHNIAFSVTHRLCSGCGTTTRLVALRD